MCAASFTLLRWYMVHANDPAQSDASKSEGGWPDNVSLRVGRDGKHIAVHTLGCHPLGSLCRTTLDKACSCSCYLVGAGG